jgi:type IV pilus biogenesis protein PilP
MFKSALKATVAYTVFMLGLSVPALAADAVAPLPLGNTPPAATPAVTTTTTTTTAPLPTGMPPLQGTSATTSTTTTAPLPNADGSLPPVGNGPSNLTSPASTPKIVQEAMTGLQKTDPINMDDMIRAQDAINRLDLLLEIEKRQNELKKLREERNKPAASASMASSIPASALQLPPMKVNPMPSSGGGNIMALPKPADVKPSGDNYALKRIVGSEGRYSAVISAGDNKVINVRSGETLPDGSKVKSVSLMSVILVKDKKSKTLTIPSDSYIVRGSEELIP